MNVVKTVLKIVSALVFIAGAVYVVATYGDKIVAWAKKLLNCCGCQCECPCEGDCEDCNCEDDCTECQCTCDCECACEATEEAPAEEAPAEEATAEETASDAVVATDADFEG